MYQNILSKGNLISDNFFPLWLFIARMWHVVGARQVTMPLQIKNDITLKQKTRLSYLQFA